MENVVGSVILLKSSRLGGFDPVPLRGRCRLRRISELGFGTRCRIARIRRGFPGGVARRWEDDADENTKAHRSGGPS